ncbi:antibiotic transport system ATP-binding protein [Thermotomaculum hydrothermale]|uniref:Antibiotic transport system ATP-binding protein n=1 Tax=Thermotomaculum hydrothermale TaxID=981385 RepID=A0A7R6PGQ8_9BACT|nr:ABC transporter ATP-binding protein [Thermotomaculum hydrothermale]BBB33468.1 antibiotic transport system ATP-binding protein [Thermotomaculum hydrothermale]
MENYVISLKNIAKSYNGYFALNNISLDFEYGVIAGIVGPNGAGKSTLMKIISGLIPHYSGVVEVDGIENPSFFERVEKISFLPEDLILYPSFKVREFVNFVEESAGKSFDELKLALGINSVLDKHIFSLSKGYKQRLKLFFALANDKRIILLDEPFDGFDPIQLIEIIDFLKNENKRGRTFVISIHDLNNAEKVCNYFVLLKNGKIVEKGDLNFLCEKYKVQNCSLEEVFIEALK